MPSHTYPNGDIVYYITQGSSENIIHREDGPAVILPNGELTWVYMGQRIEVKSQEEFERWMKLKAFFLIMNSYWSDTDKYKPNRTIIENGLVYCVSYWQVGRITIFYLLTGTDYIYDTKYKHRELGPAVIYDYGRKEWWYQGERIPVNSQEEFEKFLKLKAFW
jgi:hypothetical protein